MLSTLDSEKYYVPLHYNFHYQVNAANVKGAKSLQNSKNLNLKVKYS